MLAHAAMLCPALIFTTPQLAPARSPSRAASIRALAPVQGSLPEMYRARWQHEADEAEEQQMTSTVDVPASSKERPSRLGGVLSIGGALAGVSLMSAIGTRTSDALAPLSLTFLHNSWSFGGAHDITAYTLPDYALPRATRSSPARARSSRTAPSASRSSSTSGPSPQ